MVLAAIVLGIVPAGAAHSADKQCRHDAPCIGTPEDDRLDGSRRGDEIFGLGGYDVLLGRGGGDDLNGGSSSDELYGGRGADVLIGGPKDDPAGTDFLFGGRGDDVLRGGSDDDSLVGEGGDDKLHGGPGGDSYGFGAGWGRDVIFDKPNFHTRVSFHELAVAVTVDLVSDPDKPEAAAFGTSDAVNWAGDVVRTVVGGMAGDIVYGNAARNRISTMEGDDEIYVAGDAGLPEGDYVDCGDGVDTVQADENDIVINCENISVVP